MKEIRLDPEEQELLEEIERDEWRSVSNAESEIARFQTYAKAQSKKSKNVNLRLTEEDWTLLKRKAAEYGMPYQTLAASLIHRFVTDQIKLES